MFNGKKKTFLWKSAYKWVSKSFLWYRIILVLYWNWYEMRWEERMENEKKKWKIGKRISQEQFFKLISKYFFIYLKVFHSLFFQLCKLFLYFYSKRFIFFSWAHHFDQKENHRMKWRKERAEEKLKIALAYWHICQTIMRKWDSIKSIFLVGTIFIFKLKEGFTIEKKGNLPQYERIETVGWI